MTERFRELLHHLRFEADHPAARRSPFAMAAKLFMLAPQAVMFLLFNFGSSFRRASAKDLTEPRGVDPPPLAHLRVELEHADRGLPYSDDTAAEAEFDAIELAADPLFALSEIQRVLQPRAMLTVRAAGRFVDPRQRRAVTPEVIETITAGGNGIPRLFELVRSDSGAFMLRSLKDTSTVIPTPRRIDLGCGTAKRPGYTGIDNRPLPGVDIVRDIERHGLPFSDGIITHVYASHFLEHVRDLVSVMNEIHRVSCAGAEVEFVVPTLLGPWAAADPTHVRLFNARTFEYFTQARMEPGDLYGGVTGLFQIVEQRISTSMYVRLRRSA